MNNEQIKELALAAGFKLKQQPDGSEDLNPYVYEFARKLLADALQERDELSELLEAAGIDAKEIKAENEQLRKERDELAAREAAAKSLISRLIEAPAYRGGPRPAAVQEFIDWASGGIDHLARRDARMKSEALEEARSICIGIERGQREMSYKYTETDGDGDEMVVGPGVDYGNKAMGAGHCRERIAELIAEYREQAATEAMDAIDGEDGDFANVRGVVERMIAAGYRKQAEGVHGRG